MKEANPYSGTLVNLVTLCEQQSECVGFKTFGEAKTELENIVNSYFPNAGCAGFYTKIGHGSTPLCKSDYMYGLNEDDWGFKLGMKKAGISGECNQEIAGTQAKGSSFSMWDLRTTCEADSNCRGFTSDGCIIMEPLPDAHADYGWESFGNSDCNGTFYKPQEQSDFLCEHGTSFIHSNMLAAGFEHDDSSVHPSPLLSNGYLLFDYRSNAAENLFYKTVCNEQGGHSMLQTFTAICGDTSFTVIDHPRCYDPVCDANVSSSNEGEDAAFLVEKYSVKSTEERNSVECTGGVIESETDEVFEVGSSVSGTGLALSVHTRQRYCSMTTCRCI